MKNFQLHASLSAVLLVAFLLLPACSVNVKKDSNGEDKKVDIETPVGSLHVGNNADPADTGLPIYPGARKKQKEDNGDEKSANVNLSTSKFGLKVVAVEFESDASPEKVIAYYQDQLKKYGNVLVCHTKKHHGESVEMHSGDDSKHDHNLKCEGDNSGEVVELKVGTDDNQHIVSIQPEGKGTEFALVYVRTRDNDTI